MTNINKIFALFFLVLLLFTTTTNYAQVITVTDQQNEEPIEGVVILNTENKKFITTNTNGQADVSEFDTAKKILISHEWYVSDILSFNKIKSENFNIKLKPSNLNLDEVIISGTKWHQKSSNTPSKITSISKKRVALQNPQTAADLLGISGKVFIQKSQQGGGSPLIRGFATNRLVYSIDGVRMNTAIFRSGNLQNVISLDPFATEKTEILFGPGSVIYGSDAIGGVMSFKTLTPEFSLNSKLKSTINLATRYSSANNEKTGHFDVNLGWKKWALITSLSSWDYDHLKQGRYGPDYIKNTYPERQNDTDIVITQNNRLLQIPSAYSQVNLMQKVRFKPSEDWELNYSFHYSKTSTFGRYDRHNRFRGNTFQYAEWNYGPQKWLMNNLNISHKGNNKLYDEASLKLAKQHFEESRINRNFNNNIRNTTTEMVAAYSINLDFTKNTNQKNTVYYGLEYVKNNVKSVGKITDITTNINQDGIARYPNATWNSLGAYINDELRISKTLTLQGGMRYNQFILDADFTNNQGFFQFPFTTSKINNGALSGSIGAVYRPEKKLVFKINFGTAFRSPNVDDIGKIFDSEPGAVTVPNPDLKAENAYNFDIGLAKVFKKSLKIDLTAYYTILQNALVRRDFRLNGQDEIVFEGELSQIQAIQNAASATVFGIQAGLEIKLYKGLNFISDINYQVGEEELDNGTKSPSRHAPPLFGLHRLTYQYKKITTEFNINHQATLRFENLAVEEQKKDGIYAKDENGNNFSPAWYTLNFKTLYKINETFTLSSGIENITNRRYRPYSSGISGAGTNFVISVKAKL